MPKPIVVIYLPENYTTLDPNSSVSVTLMQNLNDTLGDYYWFCFPKYDIDEPEFKVFYEKDFTDAKFEELSNIISEGMKRQLTHDMNGYVNQ